MDLWWRLRNEYTSKVVSTHNGPTNFLLPDGNYVLEMSNERNSECAPAETEFAYFNSDRNGRVASFEIGYGQTVVHRFRFTGEKYASVSTEGPTCIRNPPPVPPSAVIMAFDVRVLFGDTYDNLPVRRTIRRISAPARAIRAVVQGDLPSELPDGDYRLEIETSFPTHGLKTEFSSIIVTIGSQVVFQTNRVRDFYTAAFTLKQGRVPKGESLKDGVVDQQWETEDSDDTPIGNGGDDTHSQTRKIVLGVGIGVPVFAALLFGSCLCSRIRSRQNGKLPLGTELVTTNTADEPTVPPPAYY